MADPMSQAQIWPQLQKLTEVADALRALAAENEVLRRTLARERERSAALENDLAAVRRAYQEHQVCQERQKWVPGDNLVGADGNYPAWLAGQLRAVASVRQSIGANSYQKVYQYFQKPILCAVSLSFSLTFPPRCKYFAEFNLLLGVLFEDYGPDICDLVRSAAARYFGVPAKELPTTANQGTLADSVYPDVRVPNDDERLLYCEFAAARGMPPCTARSGPLFPPPAASWRRSRSPRNPKSTEKSYSPRYGA